MTLEEFLEENKQSIITTKTFYEIEYFVPEHKVYKRTNIKNKIMDLTKFGNTSKEIKIAGLRNENIEYKRFRLVKHVEIRFEVSTLNLD